MPEILVKFANKIIERIVTEKEHITIGRTNDNDIVLDNRGVSRKHAQIEFSENGALLIDNDSLNGTFLNERKVTEQKLTNNDKVTIGKFDLIYFEEAEQEKKMSDMDGTLVLNTKKQNKLVDQDRQDKETAQAAGGSVLIAVNDEQRETFPISKQTTTLGKSSFVNIRVKGLFTSRMQAKLEKEGEAFTIYNVGRKNKTKINGEVVDSATLKNGDIMEIGKSIFRFVEG